MNIKKKNAFTLIELITVLAILSIITASITSVFMFSSRTFRHSEELAKIQAEMRYILRELEKELSFASTVIVYDTVAVAQPLNSGYFFGYVNNSNQVVIGYPNSTIRTFDLSLSDGSNSSVTFDLITSDGTQITNGEEATIIRVKMVASNYELERDIAIRNIRLSDGGIGDGRNGNVGTYIEFRVDN